MAFESKDVMHIFQHVSKSQPSSLPDWATIAQKSWRLAFLLRSSVAEARQSRAGESGLFPAQPRPAASDSPAARFPALPSILGVAFRNGEGLRNPYALG